ncbi:MAG: PepSY-like domain-containing protein [Lewinellaceae bacterium]|nr:PepSY-like domain-containing protein [Lewinellaceae bacterium]
MKKLIFLFVLGLGASAMACAQKTPPKAVSDAFTQKFSKAEELKWSQEKNGDWEAEFEQDEVELSANFNIAGQWIETETEIKVADLPAAVRTALQGKKVKEAAKIMRADGTTVYEAEVKGKDMLFDDSGKLLSEEKD